jgi:hypothetical protein
MKEVSSHEYQGRRVEIVCNNQFKVVLRMDETPSTAKCFVICSVQEKVSPEGESKYQVFQYYTI